MEDNTSLIKPFKATLKFIKDNMILLEQNENFIGKLDEKLRKEFKLLEDEFKNETKYIDIKRFSIPII